MRPLFTAVLALLLAITVPALPAAGAGLLAPTDRSLPPLRITDHLVDVTVHDGIALTTVTQTFHNDTKQRLEGTYVFPLPEQADLTDFQMSFNGKMAQGRVLPAKEAAQIYESIVRQSKDPGLIEFIGRRLLQMRVFPIEPESDTTIQVRYQQICRPISGMTGYHYPLRTRKTSGQAYGTVRFAVDLDTAAPLKNIWSPSHAVEIVRGEGERTAKIAYEANGGSLEDDFVLLYSTDASDLGLSVVAHKPDTSAPGHFVLMLTPKQLWPDREEPAQDVVFVMDTSGSMAGDKIDQARKALAYCIEQLDDSDRFSVVRFSTGFDVLFDELAHATPEARAKAVKWVEAFRAAGGTNITDTLHHVMGMRDGGAAGKGERPFVVVFLTDGRGNREAAEIMNTLADAGAEKTGMRIFPFGVGHDVNTKLLDRLAEGYVGRTTYVQPGENLELVMGDFFSVISRPVLTDLRITLPEIGAMERFPATLGDLYHGQQVIVVGRFTEEGSGSVGLTAQRGDERVEYAWPNVAFRNTPGAEYVAPVWAGRKIAYLVDQIRAHGESSEMIEEILALSMEHGIQTPYTSWLVDPERATTIERLGGRPMPIRDRRMPAASGRVPPGAGGIGRGGSGLGGGAPREEQERRLLRLAEDSPGLVSRSGGLFGADGKISDAAGYAYGDEFGDIDLFYAGVAVTESAGEAANVVARLNANLRESRTRDDGRLDRTLLPAQKIESTWYNRIGRLLVDERFGAETEVLVVRFASDAYFELIRSRPELRKAFAASPVIVVMMTEKTAVLVSDRVGVEEFSPDQMKQIGLEER